MTTPTTLALMQPYLFPYVGSFALIAATDIYVVFDNVQYIRRGWMHRNRIHKPGGGWQYIGVSVQRAPRDTLIRDIQLSDSVDWRGRLLEQLERAYAGHAPHHSATLSPVAGAIAAPVEGLADLNVRTMAAVCARLDLPFRPIRATGLDLPPPQSPHGWAVTACGRLGAKAYINPPGAADLYPTGSFADAGLRLGILRPRLEPYDRAGLPWEPGLSVLDALMFLDPPQVRARVCAFDVEWRTA